MNRLVGRQLHLHPSLVGDANPRWPAAFVTLIVIISTVSVAAWAVTLTDTEQHWARDSIRRLGEQGVIAGYPDEPFRPEDLITRAEFAHMAARAFRLQEGPQRVFPDAQDHWAARELSAVVNNGGLKAGPDATINPEGTLTRGELAQSLVALMGLHPLATRAEVTVETPLFEDVPPSDPAFFDVQLAARLDLFPPFFRGRLWPYEAVTRGEAAYMIDAAARLEMLSGRVERIDLDRHLLWVSTSAGQRSYPVTELDVLTPDGWQRWDELRGGDRIHLIINRFGRPLLAWTEPRTTYDGLLGGLQGLATNLLTAEQLKALLNGEWEMAAEALKAAIYQELVNRGVRPWEAEALLAQDWPAVQELGRQRISEALASYLGISVPLATALLEGDWATAREYAQMEALERLLQEHLFESSPPSPERTDGSRPDVSPQGTGFPVNLQREQTF